MKNFFSYACVFLITLIVFLAYPPPSVFAQASGGCSSAGGACTLTTPNDGTCLKSPEGDFFCQPKSLPVSPDTAAANTPTTGPPPPADPGKETTGIMAWIASLFAWLAGVAMITLNYAMYYTVIKMGDYVHSLNAVGVTWRILRDLGNIGLIFGFLAIGISTIIGLDIYGWKTKLLPMLLVAAVFLNFSLFISEAIIDTGNLFATQFYTQINGGTLPTEATLGNQGISSKIMQTLGLQKLYDVRGDGAVSLYKDNPLFVGFMSIILFIILAFVLFSLAFVLIARFVILLVLIIVAPIGFIGLAIPALHKTAVSWWSKLVEQTVTAPVLLLLLYIALAVITDKNFLTLAGKPPDWLGLFKETSTNIGGYASALLPFIVAMALLLLVVIQAKSLSAFGAGWATKMGGKLSFGVTAWAGRRTVGRLATASASRFKNSKYARSNIGRLFATGLDKAAKGSYDIRGTGVLKNLPNGGIDAGKAQEGGYAKIKEDATEARVKYAKTLNLTEKEELEVKRLEKERDNLEKGIKKTDEEISNLNTKIRDINTDIKQAEKDGKDTTVLRKDKETIESRKKVVESSKNKQEEYLKKVKEDHIPTAKNTAQIQYAEGMKRWSTIGGPESIPGKILSVPYSLLVGPAANKEASRKILKEAKKSKEEQELDAFRTLLAKADEKKPPASTVPGAAASGTPSGTAPAAPKAPELWINPNHN